jgi:N6-adenosine-specific RNA methylase IME4
MSSKSENEWAQDPGEPNHSSGAWDVYLSAEQCKTLKVHPRVAKYQPISQLQYEALRDDVARVGVKHPATVDPGLNFVIEGIHRVHAGGETGRGCPAIYYNHERDGDLRDFVLRENLKRRHQSASSLAWTCAKYYDGKLGDNQYSKREGVQICTGSLPVSQRSVRSGVCARDRGSPELHRALDADEIPVSLAERVVNQWPKQAQQDAIIREARASASESSLATKIQMVMQVWRNRERVKSNRAIDPEGELFDVILDDSPWMFPGDEVESGNLWSVSAHYPPMPTDKICEYLPVSRIAKDAALFMWCTEFHLYRGDARKVMEARGFRYYSTMVWDKVIIGLGSVIRHQHEPLIIGARGSLILTRPKEMITSIYREQRTRKHSQKPKIYGLIDSIVPSAARRVELFNRGGAPPPWIVFGNESGDEQ